MCISACVCATDSYQNAVSGGGQFVALIEFDGLMDCFTLPLWLYSAAAIVAVPTPHFLIAVALSAIMDVNGCYVGRVVRLRIVIGCCATSTTTIACINVVWLWNVLLYVVAVAYAIALPFCSVVTRACVAPSITRFFLISTFLEDIYNNPRIRCQILNQHIYR